jgi:1-acyl-sn-glycerol-3-phosphate acyltransferase
MKILYYTGWSITRIISKLIFRIKVTGRGNIPKSGGFILVSNHISWYDPLVVGSWARRQVYFFAKRELFENKLFGSIIRRTNALPVKRGAVDRGAIEASLKVIRNGYGLTFFPEGTRSKIAGFLTPKPGIGMLAFQARCPIVPCYVHGTNRLKACFWGQDRMRVAYGSPLDPTWLDSFPHDKEGYQQIAESIMQKIGELRDAAHAGTATA